MSLNRQFVHNILTNSSPPLVAEFGPRGKVYRAPNGNTYESVTTVIGKAMKKDSLTQWRKKVGEKEADRISQQAAQKGHGIHSLCEGYLLNDPDYAKNALPFTRNQFNIIRPVLNEHVGTVFGIECQLCSDYLRAAGTADLVCEWKGRPAIVDFKGSVRPKKEEWITNYFVQASTYALMASARLGFPEPIDQIVVIVAVDFEPQPQVFERKASDYASLVKEIFVNRGNYEGTKAPTSAARELG